jgi:hypothetical protein
VPQGREPMNVSRLHGPGWSIRASPSQKVSGTPYISIKSLSFAVP